MTPSPSEPHAAALEDYDEQASTLLEAFGSGDRQAQERVKWEHPGFRDRPLSEARGATITLDDARLVVAREHAFETWAELVAFTEEVRGDGPLARFEAAAEAVVSGDVASLRSLLREDPELVRARSTRRHHATLLHYIAANGVEGMRQRTPRNAVEVATLLLESGAQADALADMYGERCTTMSMLVSSTPPAEAGLQVALAEMLIDHGATWIGPGSKWRSAVATALVFSFPDTAEALARRGAPIEDLPTAAGLGRIEQVAALLPSAAPPARHAAFALAAQLGRTEIVGMLLDAGEDPDRYNPDDFHAHATPLHQAVASDHIATVRLLVGRGARLDLRDTIYEATPLEWAEYLDRKEIAEYLGGLGGR